MPTHNDGNLASLAETHDDGETRIGGYHRAGLFNKGESVSSDAIWYIQRTDSDIGSTDYLVVRVKQPSGTYLEIPAYFIPNATAMEKGTWTFDTATPNTSQVISHLQPFLPEWVAILFNTIAASTDPRFAQLTRENLSTPNGYKPPKLSDSTHMTIDSAPEENNEMTDADALRFMLLMAQPFLLLPILFASAMRIPLTPANFFTCKPGLKKPDQELSPDEILIKLDTELNGSPQPTLTEQVAAAIKESVMFLATLPILLPTLLLAAPAEVVRESRSHEQSRSAIESIDSIIDELTKYETDYSQLLADTQALSKLTREISHVTLTTSLANSDSTYQQHNMILHDKQLMGFYNLLVSTLTTLLKSPSAQTHPDKTVFLQAAKLFSIYITAKCANQIKSMSETDQKAFRSEVVRQIGAFVSAGSGPKPGDRHLYKHHVAAWISMLKADNAAADTKEKQRVQRTLLQAFRQQTNDPTASRSAAESEYSSTPSFGFSPSGASS